MEDSRIIAETSRQRVLKAINHIQPEIVPVHILTFDPLDRWLEHFGAVDELDLRDSLGLDIREARPVHTGHNAELGLDIWGSRIGSVGSATGAGYSSVRQWYPLADATSVQDIDNFAWPDPDDFDYHVAAEVLKSLPGERARWAKMVYGSQTENQTRLEAARAGGPWIPLLCGLFDLFGMEKTMTSLYTDPGLIEAAVAHLEAFTLAFEKRLLEATRGLVDIFWYGDDFATQRGLLISPEHWRRFLKPSYTKIYGLAKDYGLKVWIHSCGTFRTVIPDMIDMGMDVWETTQAHLPGNEPIDLKREYGNDITFFGGINTQTTLPYGTTEDVRDEVRERIRVLGDGGGYICGADHTILMDVPIENVLAMIDEAQRFRF